MAVALKVALNYTFRFKEVRRIMTSSIKSQKAIDKLQENPFYEKYADRIATLQKTSPEEFLKKVERRENTKDEKTNIFAPIDTRQFSSVLNPKESLKDDLTTKDKNLEEIFKVELVKDKDAAEVKFIWEEYHKSKEVISATIPSDIFSVILENMKQYPTFIFPLPRSQGYEFIMCQSNGHRVHFTPLLAYQVHKENAPECLTMVHYTELRDKGIVLMRGEYDKNVLNGKEAQCLANQFLMYFDGKDERKYNLLKTFTNSPDSFQHMDLISDLENIKLE